MEAVLHDYHTDDNGDRIETTRDIVVPDMNPVEVIQPDRIAPVEKVDGDEHIYRLQSITKDRIAHYRYHRSRWRDKRVVGTPRIVP